MLHQAVFSSDGRVPPFPPVSVTKDQFFRMHLLFWWYCFQWFSRKTGRKTGLNICPENSTISLNCSVATIGGE
jgi:hypothetical protein